MENFNNNINNDFYGSYLFPHNKTISEEINNHDRKNLSSEKKNLEGNKENNNSENKNNNNGKEQIELSNEILNEIFKELDSENI